MLEQVRTYILSCRAVIGSSGTVRFIFFRIIDAFVAGVPQEATAEVEDGFGGVEDKPTLPYFFASGLGIEGGGWVAGGAAWGPTGGPAWTALYSTNQYLLERK